MARRRDQIRRGSTSAAKAPVDSPEGTQHSAPSAPIKPLPPAGGQPGSRSDRRLRGPADPWVFTANTVGTLVLLVYTLLTYGLWKETRRAGDNAAEASRLTAKALEITREQLELTTRLEGPQIVFVSAEPLPVPLTPGRKTVSVVLKNVGRSRANKVFAFGTVEKLPDRVDKLWREVPPESNRPTIEPNQVVTLRAETSELTREDIDEVMRGPGTMKLKVEVQFFDVFEKERENSFCLRLSPQDGVWHACEPFSRDFSG